jgi:hypothetical protein
MKNEERIVELLAEMLLKFDDLTDEVKGVKNEVKDVKGELKDVNKRLGKVENEIVKLNLVSAANSRAILKLADNSGRISRLEKAVFK